MFKYMSKLSFGVYKAYGTLLLEFEITRLEITRKTKRPNFSHPLLLKSLLNVKKPPIPEQDSLRRQPLYNKLFPTVQQFLI